MKLSKTSWWMIGGAGVSVLSIGAFIFFNKRLNKKPSFQGGVKKSITGVQAQNMTTGVATKQVPNWDNAFDMNYTADVKKWVAPKTITELDAPTAIKYARMIKKAKGVFNDDEALIRTIFSKRLKDKTNVSRISQAFWQLYKIDMWQYLSSFLSKNELNNNVHKFVKALPNYTIT